jgi:hypothetical protein
MVNLEPPIPSRVRTQPSLTAHLLCQIGPGEFVEITAGPHCADDHTWWQVRSAPRSHARPA